MLRAGEGVYRLDQPDGANAYQVLGGHAAVFVLFCQIHHQPQVVGDQLLAGGGVPGGHAVKQGFFLLGGQGRGQAGPARQIMHRAAVAQTPPQPLPHLPEKLQHGYPSCAIIIICMIGGTPSVKALRLCQLPRGGSLWRNRKRYGFNGNFFAMPKAPSQRGLASRSDD